MEDYNKKNNTKKHHSDSLDNKNSPAWWQPSIVLFVRFSGWIAIPIIIGVFVGNELDNKYGTAPWLFLTSVGLTFFISIFGLVKEVSKEFKRINSKKNNKNINNKTL